MNQPETNQTPFAKDLSADDVVELTGLVRAQTDEPILSIEAEEHGVEVCTGVLAAADAGEGQSFSCQRNEAGWHIVSVTRWIA